MSDKKIKKTLNAKLFVRILPSIDINYNSIKVESNRQVLYIRCWKDVNKGINLENPNYWSFCADEIFWNSSQSEVFETITSDIFDNIFSGVSALIVSYGQTGSGKTFTTSGLRYQYQNRGLILRVLTRLIDEEEQKRDTMKITFGMKYLEFVGEKVKDLLGDRKVEKVTEVPEYFIHNEEWAWKQIFNAECRKSYSEEAPYMGSNNGHSVLTFYVHCESLIDTDPVITHSRIHIVDMAGFDNYGSKASAWRNKWELGQSNLSKSLMERLIIALSSNTWKCEDDNASYKCSRFLVYLHDTLQPNCLVRFIAHVHGNDENLPITVSALRFGEKISAFRPAKLERVMETDCALQLKNLENECLRLKEEAEVAEMLNDSPGYCNISQNRLLQVKRAAEAFLVGQLENLTLFSLGQASLTLDVFKDIYQKLSAEKDQMIKDAVSEALQKQTLASEKNPNSTSSVISNTQRISRRKSRQQESQVSMGAHRSTDSSQANLKKGSSILQEGGLTDRRGISIGPGKMSSNFEGNVTKAFKKLKSRRSDTATLKSCRSIASKDISLKIQVAEDVNELPLPQFIPSREAAWQNFYSENCDLINSIRANLESHEEATKASRKKYLDSLAEMVKLRTEIENYKSELENCRHIRHIYEKEEFDEFNNLIPGEREKEFMEFIAQKEYLLNAYIENCHVALIDFKSMVQELNEAKKALEDSFQEFCKVNYKTAYHSEETTSPDYRTGLTEEDSFNEIDSRNQAMIMLYFHLQQKLLNHVPKRKKKEWKKY